MSEDTKIVTPDGGEGNPTPESEAIKKLTEQVENLNKGISTYRDEAKNALEVAKAATEKLALIEKAKEDKETKDSLAELSEEDQKKFEAWAKSKGVVTQSELDTERARIASESSKNVASTAVSDFLEKHPEYDDDVEWAKIQAEFAQYKTPTDIQGYKKLLDKIHKELSGEPQNRAKAQVKAELAVKERLTLGGRGGGKGNESHDSRVDELQAKYPNLSRDQIEARLSEIDSIYKK